MSIEAFIWNYRDGEPIGFDFDTVRDILSRMGVMAEFHASKNPAKDTPAAAPAASSESETN